MSGSGGEIVKKMVLVPAGSDAGGATVSTSSFLTGVSQQRQQDGAGGGGLEQRQSRDALADPLERHILNLDELMERILRDRSLTPEQKLHRYLVTMRSYLLYKAQIGNQQSEPVPVRVVSGDEMAAAEGGVEGGVEGEEQQQQQPQVQLNFDSVKTYGKQKQPFAKSNILKSIEARVRPRAKQLLDALSSNDNFEWDKTSGELAIDGKPVFRSGDGGDVNLRELVLHRVRDELGETSSVLGGGEPSPPQYRRFAEFLQREGIRSGKDLREKTQLARSAVDSSGAVAKQARSRDLMRKKPVVKRKRLQQTGSGKKKCCAKNSTPVLVKVPCASYFLNY